jgi:DNA primase
MSSVHQAEATRAPRYRGVSYTSPIDAAKEAVLVIDLANRLASPGKMHRLGKTWATNCVLPNHEDRSPSFVVYPETNSWYCFSCLRGGDVVELARLAWGYDERDAHVAAAYLLMEFGHEVPQRPPAWFRKQQRQQPVRLALEEVKARSAQRKLMRLFKPYLARIEDADERYDEALKLWDDLGEVARLVVKAASQ